MAEKKGLFGRKAKNAAAEELEKAKQEAEAAKKALKEYQDRNVEVVKERLEIEKERQAAEKKIAELESKVEEMAEKEKEKMAEVDREKMIEERKKTMEERKAKIEALKKSAILATHTVQSGETLSHIALKYYKHATPPYWQFLLEHNKEVLKGSEKNVRTGMELEIPELPDELKD
jgi:nucleoid-associated protein YgaU